MEGCGCGYAALAERVFARPILQYSGILFSGVAVLYCSGNCFFGAVLLGFRSVAH